MASIRITRFHLEFGVNRVQQFVVLPLGLVGAMVVEGRGHNDSDFGFAVFVLPDNPGRGQIPIKLSSSGSRAGRLFVGFGVVFFGGTGIV